MILLRQRERVHCGRTANRRVSTWSAEGVLRAAIIVAALPLGCTTRVEREPNVSGVGDQHHDLGLVFATPAERRSLILSHTFEVTNTRDAPMTLVYHGSSCGCTTPQIDQPIVMPGESTSVVVRIEAAGKSDQVTEYTVIATGLKEIPQLRLTLSAHVVPRMEIVGLTPHPVMVARGGTEKLKFHVLTRRRPTEPDSVLAVDGIAHSNVFSLELGEATERTVGGLYVLKKTPVFATLGCPEKIEYPDQPVGKRLLRFVDGVSVDEQVIVWMPALPIRAEPVSAFVTRTATMPASQAVAITADRGFSLIDAEIPHPDLQLECDKHISRQRHVLRFSAPAINLDGRPRLESLTVQIRTDHPDQETVVIPVRILNLRR